MKFKTMHISDIESRQQVMQFESSKENILFAEKFESSSNTNNEFVIGLPLEVREYDQTSLQTLLKDLRTSFSKFCNETYAIAIHSKKEEAEVHFHISYNGIKLNENDVRDEFLKYN